MKTGRSDTIRIDAHASRFENRNGVASWRVAGWLHGVRIRKNFPTREEAVAEKQALEIKAAQTANGMRTVKSQRTSLVPMVAGFA